jgi:ABC-2 type transport system ATP-binding protein
VPVLQTHDLVKRYGKIEALKGVSLQVEKGEIYGLLGQNGAGKTTLIKVLLGIAHKSSGSAWLLDEPAGSVAVRRRIGYLPEDHHFPGYHTGETLLNFYAKLTGVPRDERRRRNPALLELVGLSDRTRSKVRTYSKGMKQRLGLAQAMYHRPEVIFLDEPTDGVDPLGRREIREVMQRLRELGTTIFLNSHLLGEVELVCDRVAILQRGAVVREGDVSSLTRVRGLYLIGLAPGEAFPEDEAERLGYRPARAGDLWEVSLTNGQAIDPLVKMLVARGLNLRHLVEKRQTLEDLFLQTVTARR